MFEAERLGLEAIRSTGTIRAPEPLLVGSLSEKGAFLIMEHIEFAKPVDRPKAMAQLGQQLAQLHLADPPALQQGFGFIRNNTVGSTPQINTWNTDWREFFFKQRLQPQVELTKSSEIQALAAKLYKWIPDILYSSPTKPSLIHGDLWTGNFAFAADTLEPVLYDPACYWADSEAEFGISYMQGGLGSEFFNAYKQLKPTRDEGWRARRELYKLYHALNHFNLWGKSWLETCTSTLEALLATELRSSQ